MVIYVAKDGSWVYSWDIRHSNVEYKAIDLDRWHEYDLNELEVLACLEALEE